MRISGKRIFSCGLQLMAVAALAMLPLSASATPDKCGKELTKWGEKAQTDTGKELQKCIDGVEKEVQKGDKGKLGKAADKCEKSMNKIGLDQTDIANNLKSKLGKAYSKILDAGVKSKCVAGDLTQAGFVSESLNDAARQLMAQAVGDAWQQQLQTNGISYLNMVTATEEADVTGCSTCEIFVKNTLGNGNTNGPCPRLACTLSGSSGIRTTAFGTFPANVALFGDVTATACDLPQVYPDTIVLYSGPSGAISAQIPILADVCIDTFRSQGTLATSNLSVADYDTEACADKNSTTSDECSGFTNCTAGTANQGQETQTCYDVGPGSTDTGFGSLTLSQRLTVVTPASVGPPDCPNAAVAPGEPTNIVLTTGTASAELWDGGLNGSIGSLNLATTVTGSAFSDPEKLSGGTWVGAFSSIDDDGSGVGDAITDLTFECL